jgi:hypothetical protein
VLIALNDRGVRDRQSQRPLEQRHHGVPVGEAADCEARDEKTREVTLPANKETPVPVLIDPDFEGTEIEIRVSDPQTRVVWAKRKLKNAMLD